MSSSRSVAVSGEESLLPMPDLGGNAVIPPFLVVACDKLFHKAMNRLIFWRKGPVLTRIQVKEGHVLICMVLSLASSLGVYGYWKYHQQEVLLHRIMDLIHAESLEQVLDCDTNNVDWIERYFKKQQLRMNELEVLVCAELRAMYEHCSLTISQLHDTCDHLLHALMQLKRAHLEAAKKKRRIGGAKRRAAGGAQRGQYIDDGELLRDEVGDHYSDDDELDSEDERDFEFLQEHLEKIQEKMDEITEIDAIDLRRAKAVSKALKQMPVEKADFLEAKQREEAIAKMHRRQLQRESARRSAAQMGSDDDFGSAAANELDTVHSTTEERIVKIDSEIFEKFGLGIAEGIALQSLDCAMIGKLECHRNAHDYIYGYQMNQSRQKRRDFWLKVGFYTISGSFLAVGIGSVIYDGLQTYWSKSATNAQSAAPKSPTKPVSC